MQEMITVNKWENEIGLSIPMEEKLARVSLVIKVGELERISEMGNIPLSKLFISLDFQLTLEK
jgi:hypothetical protein